MGFSIKTKTKVVSHMEQRQGFFFLSLYTKTHLWAYTWIEKRGGLARTRNGPKARFQRKSVDLPLPLRMNRFGTHLVLLPINFGFAYLNKTTGLF